MPRGPNYKIDLQKLATLGWPASIGAIAEALFEGDRLKANWWAVNACKAGRLERVSTGVYTLSPGMWEKIKSPPPTVGLPAKYQPPRVRAGDWLEDVLLGQVQVGGYHTAGLIPWPYRRRTGAHSLILTYTLAEAVRHESATDIMQWFGVNSTVVWGWRKALGVDRKNNEGTVRRYKALRNIPPEAAARGREKAAQPEARQKMLQSIAAGMNTRKHAGKIQWTEKMDALLGTMPDQQAAATLGLSKTKVALRRTLLGIPPHRTTQEFVWTPEREAKLGKAFDTTLAAEWGISAHTVLQRRQRLGIPAFSVSPSGDI